MLSDIESLPVLQTAVQQKRKFVLHMDNSPVHKSRAVTERVASLRLVLTLYPPYSPDFAPSDFFLFGYLKKKMIRINFESPRELIDWIQSICEAIPRHVLDEIFIKPRFIKRNSVTSTCGMPYLQDVQENAG
jgi:transposase